MTDFEIIMIMLGIVGLPISAGALILALLDFLERRKEKRK